MTDEGFSKPLVLPDSHKHDSVLCVELADVDWDGQDEIVLGTFGKVICMYSCVSITLTVTICSQTIGYFGV